MTRARLVSTILAILLVTVAAVADRLSKVDTDSELVRAPIDQAVSYESGRVLVSDVRVGSELREGDDLTATRGLFVVVHVAVRATGRDSVTAANSRLLAADGLVYLPAFDLVSSVRAEPGFETARDLVFEVDPARIDDLTLELWDQGLVYRYYQRTQTPLGITAGKARQWAEAGAGRSLVVVRDDVSTGLS